MKLVLCPPSSTDTHSILRVYRNHPVASSVCLNVLMFEHHCILLQINHVIIYIGKYTCSINGKYTCSTNGKYTCSTNIHVLQMGNIHVLQMGNIHVLQMGNIHVLQILLQVLLFDSLFVVSTIYYYDDYELCQNMYLVTIS